MRTLFRCPLCQIPLTREEGRYVCTSNHSFDIAKEGYVHLLPVNKMNSKSPGDDKFMALSRNNFLSKDYYKELCNLLCKLSETYSDHRPTLLDSGCGEGYYTANVYHHLQGLGKEPLMAGIDLSKPSLRWAGKREKEIEFAVASVYHMPIRDQSMDLLLNCFSPLALDEFTRVLKPGGYFFYVVPDADHLWELKEVLYPEPYKNTVEDTTYDGFDHIEVAEVRDLMHLESQDDIQALFRMTPYFWKTPKEGTEKLATLETLDVTASFRVHVFRKK